MLILWEWVILVTIVTSSNVLNEDYLYIMFELS